MSAATATDQAAGAWAHDRQTGQHFRPFDGDGVPRAMVVYKTGGGDYAITCMSEGDPCGSDVDYEATLPKAKAKAEALIDSGFWKELAL